MICLTLNKSAGLPHIQLSTAVWLVDSFYFKLEGYRYVSCGNFMRMKLHHLNKRTVNKTLIR